MAFQVVLRFGGVVTVFKKKTYIRYNIVMMQVINFTRVIDLTG